MFTYFVCCLLFVVCLQLSSEAVSRLEKYRDEANPRTFEMYLVFRDIGRMVQYVDTRCACLITTTFKVFFLLFFVFALFELFLFFSTIVVILYIAVGYYGYAMLKVCLSAAAVL